MSSADTKLNIPEQMLPPIYSHIETIMNHAVTNGETRLASQIPQLTGVQLEVLGEVAKVLVEGGLLISAGFGVTQGQTELYPGPNADIKLEELPAGQIISIGNVRGIDVNTSSPVHLNTRRYPYVDEIIAIAKRLSKGFDPRQYTHLEIFGVGKNAYKNSANFTKPAIYEMLLRYARRELQQRAPDASAAPEYILLAPMLNDLKEAQRQ